MPRKHRFNAVVDRPDLLPYTHAMEVHLPLEKQERVQRIASRLGKDLGQVIEEAVDRMLDHDESFIAAVEEGRAAARRGELLEHDEVVERIEKMLRS